MENDPSLWRQVSSWEGSDNYFSVAAIEPKSVLLELTKLYKTFLLIGRSLILTKKNYFSIFKKCQQLKKTFKLWQPNKTDRIPTNKNPGASAGEASKSLGKRWSQPRR